LVEISDEQPTVLRAGNDPLRVDVRANHVTSVPGTSRTGTVVKIVLGLLLLGFLGLVIAGAAGAYFYMNSGGSNKNVAINSPTPIATPTPTQDDENQRLQDALENLQKNLEEQTKADSNRTLPTWEDDALPTATVNSPKDGFLALRSEPNPDYGERLAKIPHGTILTVVSCETSKVTIDGRTGRWCLVTYDYNAGWVFDAWLTY